MKTFENPGSKADPNARGGLAQPNMEVCITHSDAPYIDRLLEHYLQAGVIDREWIPAIKKRVLTTDGVSYIPWREGIKFDGPEYLLSFVKDGKEHKMYPVSLTPWATWLREGEETDSDGLCLFMPEAFFERHGRDGLPL
jgi:hypothetical protein